MFCLIRDIAKDKDLPSVQLDAVTFKSVLVKGLGSLHGQVLLMSEVFGYCVTIYILLLR